VRSLRWRVALWFTVSLLGVLAVFVAITYNHLQHELRVEKWERAQPGDKGWALHGSYSEAEVNDIVGELWSLSLFYALPVTFLALGLGYHIAQRSFEPVAAMNGQLQSIGARSLDRRVKLPQADAEFRAIEKNVNELLERLDAGFRHLTEFSAQVAHELRTPLTLLRLQVEEAAGRIEPALAESLQEELSRLSDYVDQCLLLATAEQGRLTLEIKPLPLRALVQEMIETYELLARAENRTLIIVAPEEIIVPADARTLRQMLHNLLTNALRHGCGQLVVTVAREGSETVCRVTNGIATATAAPGAGTGLGHRLVRAIAASYPTLRFGTRRDADQYVAELRFG
jgi:signal transduction histidine kinase